MIRKSFIVLFASLLTSTVYASDVANPTPCSSFGTITGTCLQGAGALGSPSSIGTLPAFTLGGTISGGGNQINNVVIGNTTPLAGSFTTITATGPLTITPTASTLNKAFNISQALGTNTTSVNCYTGTTAQFPCVNLSLVTTDNVDASSPSNTLDIWQFNHQFGGSGVKGARQSFDVTTTFTAATNASNTNTQYTPTASQMNVKSGDGGTGVTPGTARGGFFGSYSIVRSDNTATNLYGAVGYETDLNLTGTQYARIGYVAVSFPTTRGAGIDTAFLVGAFNSGTGDIGWNNAFTLANYNGFAPLATTGCVICTDGTANTIATGIDLSAYTISGNFLRGPSGNFNVTGAGTVTVAGFLSLGGAAPGGYVIAARSSTDANFQVTSDSSRGPHTITVYSLNNAGNTFEPMGFLANNFGFNAPVVMDSTLTVSGMTQTSAAQSGTVCFNSGTGLLTYDATLGCLASTLDVKDDWTDISPEQCLAKVLAMKPGSFTYKPGIGLPKGEQIGLNAQQMATIDERLVARDRDGKLLGVRYQQTSALYACAIQAVVKAENDNFEARLAKLENHK